MEHEVDAIVCGVGPGGTITGLARFFAKVSDKTEMVLADPKGSTLAEYSETGHLRQAVGSWLAEGTGQVSMHDVRALSHVRKRCKTSNRQTIGQRRERPDSE